MFNRQKTDPRVIAAQMSSLSIAWGIAAGIAYLGVVKRVIDLIAAATPWPGVTLDPGLISLNATRSERFVAPFGSYVGVVIAALPITILALIICGVLARARPRLSRVAAAVVIIAAVLGEAGAMLIFVAQVATRQNGTEFIVALATIFLVAILLRLQRFVRRFYRRSPAFATLFFALLTIVYLVLSNGTNISSIVLGQVDIWLAIIAYAIAFYSGIKLSGAARKVGRS